MALQTSIPTIRELKTSIVRDIQGIKDALFEMEREEYPKGVYYKRKRQSVPFNLPILKKDFPFEFEFAKGEIDVFRKLSAMSYAERFVISVPFTVEQVGENSFIARD